MNKMVVARLNNIPNTIYRASDLKFDIVIVVNGETLTSLTGTSAKFGLIKNPIESDSTNDISSAGTIGTNAASDAAFLFDITDTELDITAGRYTYSIEFTDTDSKKFITKYGVLTIKESVF